MNVSTDRVLFLITSGFPYSNKEPYLETEYEYLNKTFNQIYVITNSKPEVQHQQFENLTGIYFLNYLPTLVQKFYSLRFISMPVFWEEIKILKKFKTSVRFSFRIIPILLGSLNSGKRLSGLLKKIIKKRKLSESQICVYSYWCNDMAVGLGFLKLEFPTIKCISRAHGWDVYMFRNPFNYLPLRHFIFTTLDDVIFVSEHGMQYAKNNSSNDYSLSVSYLGVSDLMINSNFTNSEVLRVCTCSAIKPVKRLQLIVEALQNVENINIEWVHIGGGSGESELYSMADNLLSGKDNIKFDFKGKYNYTEVIDYYRNHNIDLFLNVSESEGLPVSIMEAMASGIPTVATKVGGIQEIVEDGKNGFLLEPDFNPDELAKVLVSYHLKRGEEKKVYQLNAYNTWKEKFNDSINYKNFVNKYF